MPWTTIKENLATIAPILAGIVGFFGNYAYRKLTLKGKETDIEGSTLSNIEKKLDIYDRMATTLEERMLRMSEDYEKDSAMMKKTIEDLERFISEKNEFIKEQRLLIVKQSKSLDYYEKKYGNRDI